MRWLLLLLLGLSLGAQAGSTTPAKPHFTSAQLTRFAHADQAVQQVRARYLAVFLQDRKDGRDSKTSQTAMQIDMANAIEATGLSLDDYNRMAHAMAEDEALRQRIEKME